MTRIPDSAFLLSVLNDGAEHELSEIIGRSQAQRGYGLTVHSRAADLRKRGFQIEQRSERDERTGRTLSFYRLADSFAQPAVDHSRIPEPSPQSTAGSASESEQRVLAAAPEPLSPDLTLFDPPRPGAYGEAA